MSRVYLYSLIILSILCTLFIRPARAQDSDPTCEVGSQTYVSWIESLNSMSGRVRLNAAESDERVAEIDGYFAFVNRGDVSDSDFFIQLTIAESDFREEFVALLVKDNLVATFENDGRGWDVEHRDVGYSPARDVEEVLGQVDSFLSAAFNELRFIEMSQCVGAEQTAAGEAVHYKLSVPPLMGAMLLTQLTGEVQDDVEFTDVSFEYWLDADQHFLSRFNAIVEGIESYRDQTISLDIEIELASTDNVQLRIPYVVQLLAMEQGLIEPDFVPEIVVLQ